ncbi:MAG: 4-hydroxy-3-methylbut-2-enyl diphosphate reductase [Bacteroidetes bacterium]|jgi:4-hydroxy-3-methylbut-2-enyl diphosphate reductase|nr:4-hydroxy-3-methylbut-2-enyl diphosphate reductase [Bacteroidota bacterium]
MKSFDIPEFYRSPIIARLKAIRKLNDPKKMDFSPTVLDFGPVVFYIARHFGFCFGVENAVEISFRAIDENPGKRIFLLSQMIHNPEVNNDLISRGVKFLMEPSGKQIIPWEELKRDDIVIIPAFGTTIEIENKLHHLGIEPQRYNTTCPFVERVWNKSGQLGERNYTIVIHGKPSHEETRATFSHAVQFGPTIIVKDMEESMLLGDYILGNLKRGEFDKLFAGRTSPGFDLEKDLNRVGVINQTTMLASDTQAIADYLKTVMHQKFGDAEIKNHFADTRDTLCYATNENQEATYGLLKQDADLAIVVGGYNSSNTSHLVELCERKFSTYFIKDDSEIISSEKIRHFDLHSQQVKETENWISNKKPVRIILTSGASCPDSVVDRVLQKVLGMFEDAKEVEQVLILKETGK